MGTTYRFIAAPAEPSPILAWFRALDPAPAEIPTARAMVLYFPHMGPLAYRADGQIDAARSPVVTVFSPQVKRGVLWTVGEVHFLASPLRSLFPELHRVGRDFARWLGGQDCVFSIKSGPHEFDYYLEGSVRNYDSPVHAFPAAREALAQGQYFVGDDDNGARLDQLCRALRLRGLDCSLEAPDNH